MADPFSAQPDRLMSADRPSIDSTPLRPARFDAPHMASSFDLARPEVASLADIEAAMGIFLPFAASRSSGRMPIEGPLICGGTESRRMSSPTIGELTLRKLRSWSRTARGPCLSPSWTGKGC